MVLSSCVVIKAHTRLLERSLTIGRGVYYTPSVCLWVLVGRGRRPEERGRGWYKGYSTLILMQERRMYSVGD